MHPNRPVNEAAKRLLERIGKIDIIAASHAPPQPKPQTDSPRPPAVKLTPIVWRANVVRQVIAERAKNRCECTGTCGERHTSGRCDRTNNEIGKWTERGDWRPAESIASPKPGEIMTIVLCADSVNGERSNDPDAMIVRCQRCSILAERHLAMRSDRGGKKGAGAENVFD